MNSKWEQNKDAIKTTYEETLGFIQHDQKQ
jgi:hypothetical protein